MGLFSSKKKTYVYSSASRMIEDADIINSNKAAVTEYLLQNTLQTTTTLKEMSIVDHMIQASQNSLPSKWGRAYRDAAAGKYHYGLPKAKVLLQEPKDLAVTLTSMFSSNEQKPTELVYGKVGQLNYFHMARQKLVTKYGWTFKANELPQLSAQVGATVYMENFTLNFPPETFEEVDDDTFFEQWGYSAQAGKTHNREQNLKAEHSLVVENPSAITPFARVYYTYVKGGKITEGTFDFGFDELNEGDDFIMACYKVGDEIKYFTGDFGSGEFPEVERVFETSETIGKFYPRLYARLNKQNLAHESRKDTEAYKNCQQFWKCVDVDWTEWVNELHDNMEDVSDVTQVFAFCGVAANSKDPDCIEYLFKYFKRLYDTQGTKSIQSDYLEMSKEYITNQVRSGVSLVISDKAYTQALACSKIGWAREKGNIGPVDTYKSEIKTVTMPGTDGLRNRFITTKAHQYKYQVTDQVVEVVTVYGLSLTEYVTGGNTVVHSGDSDGLLVPLDYSMTAYLTNRDYETVMAKSLHVVVNTLKVVKTKWYQRGVFKAVLFIAAVVMSVFTGGQSLTLYAIAIAALQAIAITVIVTIVAKIAVKLGINVNLVAAIVVIVALITGYANITGAEKIMGMSAQTLNQATNVALQVQNQMRQLEMQSLMKSMTDLSGEFETKMKELQELQDALAMDRQVLDNALWVSPNTHGVFINFGENADDYYTRTIHSGNVGVHVIDITLNSVEQMLKLPKPNFDFGIQGGI